MTDTVTVAALAIDLGTTACKASVVDIDGNILGSGLVRLPTQFGAGGAAIQDAEQMWASTLDACRAALAESGAATAASVVTVGVATQWSSIVAVDAAGLPVSPVLMWFDRRGSDMTHELEADPDVTARFVDVHGFTPGRSASLAHVLYLQSQADIHHRCAAYLEPMDYLNARFTGRIGATANSAMPYALTDNRTLGATQWSDELIIAAGVDRTRLPEIWPSMSVIGTVLPEVADSLGIPADAQVVTGVNDSIAAAFGAGALEPGRATLMMGTTGVLVVHDARRHTDIERFIITVPGALDDRYYVVAEAGVGGKIVELALAEVFGEAAVDAGEPFDSMLAAAAQSEPGANGVMFLPWVFGSAAPAPDHRHRGALIGMTLGSSSGDIARAMLEGIALQMRWLADEVEAATGTRFESIQYVGGGAQSDLWSAIMADVIGRPIEQLANPRHANARGVGLMAFVVTGRMQLGEIAERVPVRARYEPDPANAALFTKRLRVFRDLHGALAEPMSRLTDPHDEFD